MVSKMLLTSVSVSVPGFLGSEVESESVWQSVWSWMSMIFVPSKSSVGFSCVMAGKKSWSADVMMVPFLE